MKNNKATEKNTRLTYDSSIGELYRNPVGHDALARVLLQLGLPEREIGRAHV